MARSRTLELVSKYESNRNSTLNLIPSENVLSFDVLKALGSGMAGRYAGKPESYAGSKIFHELWNDTEELSRKVFHCRFANVLPVTGHVAGMMSISALCKRGDDLATISADFGGYRGYNDGYIPSVMGLKVSYLPYNARFCNIDLNGALELIDKDKPSIVILGATVFLFPHPVSKIAGAVHSYGGKLIYDGSHVLGLIAGGCFQDPLSEGADVLLGSTHKTLFGPQGGLILTNDEDIAMEIEERALYTFVDNFHLNRVAALGVALEETKIHAASYARRVIQNSKALATGLYDKGIRVEGQENGFTESHQVFLNYGTKGEQIRDALETNGIISDSKVRLGTNEVTRRGMGTREMNGISDLVVQTLSGSKSPRIRKDVRTLVSRYKKIQYTLES